MMKMNVEKMAMGLRRGIISILILVSIHEMSLGQESDSTRSKEKIKTGFSFGALPVVAYDTDLGFEYGGLCNIYYYGDGTSYPKYLHSLYLEISRYTKGSGINRLYYDSDQLIKGLRITTDISYLTDKAMQFYGFNGYKAVYNPTWEDPEHPDYKSRLFYAYDRKVFRVMSTFQGQLTENKDWRWTAGFAYFNTKTGPLDIDRLNKGKDDDDKLPDVPGIYDQYVNWGVISNDEKDGNNVTYIKGGLTYDTRDFEANPFKGMWTELVFSVAPSFLGNNDYAYSMITMYHRQYFTVVLKRVSFAYRLAYQTKLSGNIPFHMKPHFVTSGMRAATSMGMGGASTLRGINRNRVVGDGMAYGNVELRWKFFKTVLFNQNIYLGLNAFVDAGMVTDPVALDLSNVPGQDYSSYFSNEKETLHPGFGFGFKFALNENFIVSAEYGRAFDTRDGNDGFYINLNYLF